MNKGLRDTTATRARIAHVKRLIDEFRRLGEMNRDSIYAFLGMSISGGRKYVNDLTSQEIICVFALEDAPKSRNNAPGQPIYRLHKDASVVDAFIAKIDALPQNCIQRRNMVDHTTGPRMERVQTAQGSSIHMLRDDVEQRPRASKFKIPAHDTLLAALYGITGVAS